MTIDTSRFELRVALPDGVHFALGIWDKQKERFLPDKWCYSLESAERALRSAVKENTLKLVWKETGSSSKWIEFHQYDYTKGEFCRTHDLNSPPPKSINEILKASGKQIRILELVEKQYVCEFEKG